jgi:hypothetical protein
MVSKFITDYPQLIILFINLLFVLIIGLVGLWIRTMKQRIQEHITKEENAVWPKIDEKFINMEEKFHNFELNITREVTALQGNIKNLEARIPNGDIREMKAMLEVLIKR